MKQNSKNNKNNTYDEAVPFGTPGISIPVLQVPPFSGLFFSKCVTGRRVNDNVLVTDSFILPNRTWGNLMQNLQRAVDKKITKRERIRNRISPVIHKYIVVIYPRDITIMLVPQLGHR